MNFDDRSLGSPQPARIWRIGEAEYDEGRQELRVGGLACAIEAKPLALLYELLLRAGEVATKAELMRAIWPGVLVVESSLPTAVSKLRQALGDEARTIVEAVPRVGYRLGVPVELTGNVPRARLAFTLREGEAVPGRPGWRLERMLGGSGMSWLARAEAGDACHVLRFADTTEGLDGLKREAAITRLLQQALGDRPDLVPVVGWNYAARPFFIETGFHGPDLYSWTGERGGLAAIPLAERIAIAGGVADIVAAIHGVGVMHGGLGPSRTLVDPGPAALGGIHLRLVGFRTGRLSDPGSLPPIARDALGEDPALDGAALAATGDIAPELQAGGVPTMAADIHALGMLLYRLVVADWRRTLGFGWEADVADPLLRQDIADATAGDPARRLVSAAILAERLRTLPARRARQARREREAEATRQLALQVERARLRRPWLVLAMLSLGLGLVVASAAGIRVASQRNQLRRQVRITRAVDAFLTDDLLGRGNPVRSGVPDETLMEAAEQAEPAIGLRLAAEPLVAASLYRALALAFDGRNAYAPARDAFRRAIAAFETAQGSGSADATLLRLRWAEMEATAAAADSLPPARALLAAAAPGLESLGARRTEGEVWRLAARATLEIDDNDVPGGLRDIMESSRLAETDPDAIDAGTRLQLRQHVAYAEARMGRWDEADRQLAVLVRQELALHGPDHPDTLLTEVLQARTALSRGEFGETVRQVDRLYPKMVAVFGPGYRQTVMTLYARAQALVFLERYDDAVRDALTVFHTIEAQSGEHAYLAIAALNDAGTALCRSGHLEEGLADVTRSWRLGGETFGDRSSLVQFMSENIGLCLLLMKRYPEASARLDRIDRDLAGRASSMDDNDAAIDLMRAEIAAAGGDRARARSLLALPETVFARPGEDPYERRWTARLLASTTP